MHARIRYALVALIGLVSANGAYSEPKTGLIYESAFEQFDSYKPIQRRDWRSANDHVGKLGGWKYYAKEAALPGKEDAREVPSPESKPIEEVEGSRPSSKHNMSHMKGMAMEHGVSGGDYLKREQQR